MKNISTLFLFFILIVFSCTKVEKDVHDYYPKIKTISASKLSNGSVEVRADLLTQGAADLEYIGFCMDTIGNPTMMENQVLPTYAIGNSYYATFDASNFNGNRKYYFRSWASNSFGYVYGDIVLLGQGNTTFVQAPCSLNSNTICISSQSFPTESYFVVNSPTGSGSLWRISGSSNSTSINLYFGSKPSTKVFTTTSSTSPGPNQVYVSFYRGGLLGNLNPGSNVYVNQTAPNAWEVSICNAQWVNGALNTRFSCPY